MGDTPIEYFTSMYAEQPDPWGFDTSWYERRKYALTLASLPDRRYRRAVEAGCANGALTELLAPRCDELFAFDFHDDAVQRAAERLRGHAHVDVRRGTYPDDWPEGTGDLVVWSEVAYYLSDESAERAIHGLQRWLEPAGVLVAVHYTGDTDYPRRGADIGPWLDGVGDLQRVTTIVDPRFELGVWTRDA
ncbi:MAG: SAM-dependent methyltransferase [Ilumatobacteraceae bacterium]